VLHPSDVQRLNWYTTLVHAFRYAADVGADLLIIDSLDRYVRLKEGGSPTQSEEVVHVLTAEVPADCAVLGVKSTGCCCQESIMQTIDRLGLLGRTADAILRLDNVSTDSDPSLRRLRLVSRTASSPASFVCALRGGRYERVRPEEVQAGLLRSEDPLSPGEDLDRMLPTQHGLGFPQN
jgi:hypothetical protein